LEFEQQAPDHPRLGPVPALRARVLSEGELLLSEELYLRRQGLRLRFATPRSWLLLVLQGRLALDLGDRSQPQLLSANGANLCLTRATVQEVTTLAAPVQLVRLALPPSLVWAPAEWHGCQPLPLLPPMLHLLEQAQRERSDQATRKRLVQALQSYCSSSLEAQGIGLAASGDDPLQTLIDWLKPRLDQPLNAADLAAAACLSSRRLQELCQQRFSLTPMELLRQLRLEGLHRELLDPSQHHQGLGSLYKRWQLSDSPATRQAFEARYGASPAALRKQLSTSARG
jgi:AraC-like DNA-binding protein